MPITPGSTAITPPPTPLLAGYAGSVHPVARMLVEAYGGNHGSDFRRESGFEHVLPGDGINAVVGDRSGCNAQLPGCDAQRALAGIKVERQIRIIVDTVVILQ